MQVSLSGMQTVCEQKLQLLQRLQAELEAVQSTVAHMQQHAPWACQDLSKQLCHVLSGAGVSGAGASGSGSTNK